jgi:hypothetical protein
MADSAAQGMLLETFTKFLDETFENVQGIYLDKGTSLMETLDGINAEHASRECTNCASIAAHVKHITFYLDVSDRYMFTTDNFRADWGEVWRTTHAVTPAEWDELRAQLRSTYASLREKMVSIPDWNDERTFGGAWALIVHTAYHLGEIRRATCDLAG